MKPLITIIAGPTASGKSKLALNLAQEKDGVIINADSMQIYRELSILTARPTLTDTAQVPHRLFGVRAATETCSAGQWLKLALQEIQATNKHPIVVGGTGLYLSALLNGLSPIPEIPDSIYQETRKFLEEIGSPALWESVNRIDPKTAVRLKPNDRQRLSRAWAVWKATGKPLSEWQAIPRSSPDYSFKILLLMPPRETLYDSCNKRVHQMVAQGALEEVKALEGFAPDLSLLKALGVQEFRRHLQGDISLETAITQTQTATRQYAKRQTTWFRHQLTPECSENIIDFQVLTSL